MLAQGLGVSDWACASVPLKPYKAKAMPRPQAVTFLIRADTPSNNRKLLAVAGRRASPASRNCPFGWVHLDANPSIIIGMSTPSPTESPHVAAARSLSAVSRHEDALKELVKGANAGDSAAMSELGHLLLVGRNAPHLPNDGLRLIQTAAAKGQPDALHRIAALTAGGAFFAQDWAGAFRLLAQAAEAGSSAARKQLAALASKPVEGEAWLRQAERST
jgi:TPR repeat protein